AGRIILPNKTQTILIVDPDAELAAPVTAQSFKSIARQLPQLEQARRGIQYLEALESLPRKSMKLPHEFAIGERFRAFVTVALDHFGLLSLLTQYVKRH